MRCYGILGPEITVFVNGFQRAERCMYQNKGMCSGKMQGKRDAELI